MADFALPWLLATVICSMFLGVAAASVFWRKASRSTRSKSAAPDPSPTPISEGRLAQLQTDQAELFSTLEKLTTTVKRLSSRQGMRELRDGSSSREPPKGTSKADLLKHYGISGMVGPQFAKRQLEIELEMKERQH